MWRLSGGRARDLRQLLSRYPGLLFFADICSPQTVANLRSNPAIEVNVVDIFSRRGYRFRGAATVHEQDDVYRRGLELLRERDYGASIEFAR